jgi:hypothetical protein
MRRLSSAPSAGSAEIENRILTPAIRSIVRNVAGASIRVQDKNPDGTLVSPPPTPSARRGCST